MARVTILGSSGYIGRHFAKSLENSSHLNLLSSESINFFDIGSFQRNLERTQTKVMSSDYIFFLSSRSKFDTWNDKDLQIFIDNFKLFCSLYKNKQIIYLSSTDVYGSIDKSLLPISEDTRISPESFYGLSKVAAERIILEIFDKKLIHILRLPGIFGTNKKVLEFTKTGLGNKIVFCMKSNQSLELDNENVLNLRRDWVNVNYVVSHFKQLLKQFTPGLYNFTTGQSPTIQSWIYNFEEEFNCKLSLNFMNEPKINAYDLIFDSRALLNDFPDSFSDKLNFVGGNM